MRKKLRNRRRVVPYLSSHWKVRKCAWHSCSRGVSLAEVGTVSVHGGFGRCLLLLKSKLVCKVGWDGMRIGLDWLEWESPY